MSAVTPAPVNPGAVNLPGLPRWRRVALAACVAAYALLWAGGVASHWLGKAGDDQGPLASAFLLLAGVVVLLGARTRRGAAALGCVVLLGFAVEAAGVRYGLPFGRYSYTGVLRPQLSGVPLVMGAAWMAVVAFASDCAHRLRLGGWAAAAVGALWATAVDLVIDPLAANQFGYWKWAHEGAYYGIPLTNFGGWFVTGLLACRVAAPGARGNAAAGFVGTSIVLFFALVALAYSLLPVALVGGVLCAAGLLLRAPTRRANS